MSGSPSLEQKPQGTKNAKNSLDSGKSSFKIFRGEQNSQNLRKRVGFLSLRGKTPTHKGEHSLKGLCHQFRMGKKWYSLIGLGEDIRH
jgi:hypothetical protein